MDQKKTPLQKMMIGEMQNNYKVSLVDALHRVARDSL